MTCYKEFPVSTVIYNLATIGGALVVGAVIAAQFSIWALAGYGALGPVDGHDLGLRARVDPFGFHEKGGITGHACRRAEQHIPIVEKAADIVGISAGCHRQIRAFLDDGDLSGLVDPSRSGRGFGAGGGPSNHD